MLFLVVLIVLQSCGALLTGSRCKLTRRIIGRRHVTTDPVAVAAALDSVVTVTTAAAFTLPKYWFMLPVATAVATSCQ